MTGNPSIDLLIGYALDLTPGLAVVLLALFAVPSRALGVRILVAILGFVLMRDAMTGHGLWEFGVSDSVLWLRFIDDGVVLVSLAVICLLLVGALVLLFRDRARGMRWQGTRWWESVLVGLLGVVVIVLPFLVMYGRIPGLSAALGFEAVDPVMRGGAVAAGLLVPLLVFALCGNLLEEVLFRGLLQSELEGQTGVVRAALASAALFGASHAFLAVNVTGLGWPILAFTLFEGLVCAFVAIRHGVLGATVAHGGAIFLLASGLV